MKFIIGLLVGFGGAWFYRTRGQQSLSAAPQFVQQARESVSTVAAAGAQRATQVIDRTPVAPQVKDAVSRVVSSARPPAQEGNSGSAGSGEAQRHGVESALGRDRTRDGDVAPDLGTP